MNKKLCLLCVCFCVSLCACHSTAPEKESDFRAAEQGVSEDEKVFLDKYNDIFTVENAKTAALIYMTMWRLRMKT